MDKSEKYINDYLFLQKNNPNIVLKPYHLTRTTNY